MIPRRRNERGDDQAREAQGRRFRCGLSFWGARVWRLSLSVAMLAAAALLLVACGDTKVILTTGFAKDEIFVIGSEHCTLPEILVYLTNVQNQYEEVYGERIWETSLDGVSLEENVKETVLAQIAQVKSMYLMGQARGIELDGAEETLARFCADEYFASLSETEAERLGITEETLAQMYRELALADKTYDTLIADINPEISDDEARSVRIQYIYRRTSLRDGTGKQIPYSESERENVRVQMEEIRDVALSGESDFETLAMQYSDSESITVTFGKGTQETAVEEAAFALETGQISEVVEAESGFYLLKALSTLDREETEANKLVIIAERRRQAFEEEYDEFVRGLIRNLNEDLWEDVALIHDDEVGTSTFFRIYEDAFGSGE